MIYQHTLIVFNPAAQGGKSHLALTPYLTILKQEGFAYSLYQTNGNDDTEKIQKLMDEHPFDLISIVGGDGTINITLQALPHFDTPLHIIPAGTGNDLVKMLYANQSLQRILQIPFNNQQEFSSIDVWTCNQKRFINGFGAGFDGAIAQKTQLKKILFSSQAKYWIEIIKHLFIYRSFQAKINGENKQVFMLSAANGKVYGGGFKVAPNANISDGKLEIILCKPVSLFKRMYFLPLVKLGRHLHKSAIEYQQLEEITIASDCPIPAQLDGEPLIEKNFHIRKTGQVKVIV